MFKDEEQTIFMTEGELDYEKQGALNRGRWEGIAIGCSLSLLTVAAFVWWLPFR